MNKMSLTKLSGIPQLCINTRWSAQSIVREKPSYMPHVRVVWTLNPITKRMDVKTEWFFNKTDPNPCQLNKETV